MEPRSARTAQRELGLVLMLAFAGLLLVGFVAFAPWYTHLVLGLG